MYPNVKRPLKRSKFRTCAGTLFYRLKRFYNWYFGNINFAKTFGGDNFNYIIAEHSTPLLRKLKNVEMALQYNKITNLKIAAGKIDGIVINPGEVFSYWKLIGKPTKAKGYTDGMILENGKYKAGTGGGLCQLSNLIYWLTLHTELTVIERHRHGYDVFPDSNRTQPFGSGATCFYNYIDLMIKNETDIPCKLSLKVTDTHLEGKWLGVKKAGFNYEVYEKDHLMRLEPWGGYTRHNSIYRRKYDSYGALEDDEFITENHAIMMYEPLLEEKIDKGMGDC